MKGYLSLLILIFFIAFHSDTFAQACGDTVYITPGTSTTPGFSPTDDQIPCILNGSFIRDTIYFTNYSTYHSLSVNYLTIDSIENLPNGLCWSASDTSANMLIAGQNVGIAISGLCISAPGQYKLKIVVSIGAGPNNTITSYNANLEDIFGYRYYLRVSCAGDVCPNIDTVNGKTMSFIPDLTEQCTFGTAISEINISINDVTIMPNPMENKSLLSFNSALPEVGSLQITDLMGSLISSTPLTIASGNNEYSIERQNLSNGLYFVTVSTSLGSVTRKLLVN